MTSYIDLLAAHDLLANRIVELEDALRDARNKALEHAAGVCDDQAHALERNGESIEMQWTVIGCAKQIRAAKDAT